MPKPMRDAADPVPAGLDEALSLIRHRASSLPFGSFTLTIHEGRVTQLEMSEKRRFVA